MASADSVREAAGASPAASLHRVRLTPKMLRELRMALLAYGSPFTSELELVEQRYGNGDVVVRLARPDKPQSGELILGHRTEGQQAESLLDATDGEAA